MRRLLAGLVMAAASLGPASPAFADHDSGREECRWEGDCGSQSYDGQWSNEDRNRNRDRNRGAFSPGPFDRSPIDFSHSNFCISLDCSGRDQDRPPPSEGRPQQLFPPSADGIRNFVTSTVQAGIEMGRLFADTTITFVSNLLVGIA